MRRTITLLVAVATIMTLTAGTASAGRSEKSQVGKTEVCHYDADNDEFHLIRINGNAVDKHLAHGDGLPGAEGLNADCDAVAAISKLASGAYSANGLSDAFTLLMDADGSYSGTTSYVFGSHSISGTVTHACLDPDEGYATVWGPATSSIKGPGYLMVTLIDRTNGSVATLTKFATSYTVGLEKFEKQCEDVIFYLPDGAGHLTFF